MGIERFAQDVKEDVKKRLGKGYEVTVHKVDRNNGVIRTGLCVKEDKAALSPVIYIDSHYDSYKKGRSTSADAADYVADVCKRKRPVVDIRRFLNYEGVKDSIVYKLVNTDKNRELLEDLPHLEFLDLSIVFQYLVEDGKTGTATILIHNAHAKLWGVSVEELHSAAVRNTPRLRGYEIKSMKQMLFETRQREASDKESEYDVPLYVLTNRHRTDGSVCILYPRLLKDFSDAAGSSFYIIPSSLHEVLLLPVNNTDKSAEIREMIREVNDTQLIQEEILSYSLYYYDREMDEIRIA